MEVLCVEQIAYCILRLARAKLLEREQFTAVLHPPKTVNHPGSMTPDKESWGWIQILDPGRPATVSTDDLDKINRTVIRYETSIESKLNRWWNLLERLQSRRRGDPCPTPGSIDISVHASEPSLASFGNSDES